MQKIVLNSPLVSLSSSDTHTQQVQTQHNNYGYQIRCNTFTISGYAMNINPLSSAGVFNHQGICGTFQNQAGNKFLDANCIIQSANRNHINSTINFEYKFRDGYANEEPTCYYNITKYGCSSQGGNNPNTCDEGVDSCEPACRIANLRTNISTATGWQKEILQEKLVRELSVQESVDNSLEILANIQSLDNSTMPLMYIGALIDYEQFLTAQELISALPNTDDGNAFKTVYNTTLSLCQQYQSVFQLSNSQVNALRIIADGTTKANHYAQAILQARGEDALNVPIEIVTEEGSPNAPKIQSNISSNDKLFVQPNPSDGVANIKWNLGEQFVKGELKIMDIRGQILHSFQLEAAVGEYNTNILNLTSGIYFVKLHTSQDDLITKIIISR